MKKALYKTSILIYFLLFTFNLVAQVEIKVNYNCFKDKNIFYAVYTSDGNLIFERKTLKSSTIPFKSFQSAILVVFSFETQPDLYFFETTDRRNAIKPLKLKGNCKTKTKKSFSLPGPIQHFKIKNGLVSKFKFDLDNLKDKTEFGRIMGRISTDLDAFYKTNILPLEQKGFHQEKTQTEKSKQQYNLGSTIYQLSKEKKKIEQNIKKLESDRRDDLQKIELVKFQYSLLKAELKLAKIKYDIQFLKWQKAKQKYDNGKVSLPKYFQTEARFLEQEKKVVEIAELNVENKSFELAILNTKSITQMDTSLVNLRLLDIQIMKQKKNTHRIYQKHNELAMIKTGRDRLVELANAQQMVAQEVQLDYKQYANVLKRWKIMDAGTGQYKKQIDQAQKTLEKKWEESWQADMGYLEHMWHLRAKPSIKSQFDDIMRHQSDLLVGELNDRGQLAKLDPKDEKILEQKQELAELHNKAHYVVKIDKNGHKSFLKNGKPITKLTYKYETKRLFGKITEETLTESERKSLWDWFNSVILLK